MRERREIERVAVAKGERGESELLPPSQKERERERERECESANVKQHNN